MLNKVKLKVDKVKILDISDYSICTDADLSKYKECYFYALTKVNKKIRYTYVIKEILPTPSVSVLYFEKKIRKIFQKGKKYIMIGFANSHEYWLNHKTLENIIK